MELNRDNILRSTDRGLSVFRHYIVKPFQIGKNFLNPLYEDKHASCNIFLDRRSNCYRMKDFGNDDYSSDCFAFVGKLAGLDCRSSKDFIQIMEKINNDLHLRLSGTDTNPLILTQNNHTLPVPSIEPSIPLVKERSYSFQQGAFSATELMWWKQYGISETILKHYNVVPLKRFDSVSKEDKPFYFVSSENEPMYGYTGQQRIKVYRPMSPLRFVQAGKTTENYCFGLEQLPAKGDLLFITGGEQRCDGSCLTWVQCNIIQFRNIQYPC
jgi:hypothetical protein